MTNNPLRKFSIVMASGERFTGYEHDDGAIVVYNEEPHDDTVRPLILLPPPDAYERLEAWARQTDPDAVISVVAIGGRPD